jgi:hypothetical protein
MLYGDTMQVALQVLTRVKRSVLQRGMASAVRLSSIQMMTMILVSVKEDL